MDELGRPTTFNRYPMPFQWTKQMPRTPGEGEADTRGDVEFAGTSPSIQRRCRAPSFKSMGTAQGVGWRLRSSVNELAVSRSNLRWSTNGN